MPVPVGITDAGLARIAGPGECEQRVDSTAAEGREERADGLREARMTRVATRDATASPTETKNSGTVQLAQSGSSHAGPQLNTGERRNLGRDRPGE